MVMGDAATREGAVGVTAAGGTAFACGEVSSSSVGGDADPTNAKDAAATSPAPGEHVITALTEWRAIRDQQLWHSLMAMIESPDWNEPSTKWHPSMGGAS